MSNISWRIDELFWEEGYTKGRKESLDRGTEDQGKSWSEKEEEKL